MDSQGPKEEKRMEVETLHDSHTSSRFASPAIDSTMEPHEEHELGYASPTLDSLTTEISPPVRPSEGRYTALDTDLKLPKAQSFDIHSPFAPADIQELQEASEEVRESRELCKEAYQVESKLVKARQTLELRNTTLLDRGATIKEKRVKLRAEQKIMDQAQTLAQDAVDTVIADQELNRKRILEYEEAEKQLRHNYLAVKQHVQKRLKTEQDLVNNAEEFSHLEDEDVPGIEDSESSRAI